MKKRLFVIFDEQPFMYSFSLSYYANQTYKSSSFSSKTSLSSFANHPRAEYNSLSALIFVTFFNSLVLIFPDVLKAVQTTPAFVPIVSIVMFVYNFLKPGRKGSNKNEKRKMENEKYCLRMITNRVRCLFYLQALRYLLPR